MLGSFGFTPEGAIWDAGKDSVSFRAQIDAHRVPARISKMALIDYFGPSDARGEEAMVAIFQAHAESIGKVAGAKAKASQFEADGSIVVKLEDLS